MLSISKALCKLPPELLSTRISYLINMEPIPCVLPLLDAYEDLEHIHLVYAGLSTSAVALVDKIFDDMHTTEAAEESGRKGFCERTVQQIVWKMMASLKVAHGRGLVHGSLRMGCCYLNDAEDLFGSWVWAQWLHTRRLFGRIRFRQTLALFLALILRHK